MQPHILAFSSHMHHYDYKLHAYGFNTSWREIDIDNQKQLYPVIYIQYNVFCVTSITRIVI